MSQNDFNLANQGFPSMRADMNSALQALASNSSGATPPATTYAYQWWYDDASDILKFRNGDNDAWIDFASFNQATDSWFIPSVDINGGTIDGTVIGGSNPSAGAFTSLTLNGVPVIFDLASQAQAEAGTDNETLMTPLRTAQAIEELSPAPSELTEAQATDDTSTVFGTVSGERLNQETKASLNVSGAAPMFACRAWVNFDGDTSPVTIRASGNVSSVDRTATGSYTINLTTAIADANYSVVVSAGRTGVNAPICSLGSSALPPVVTTTSFTLRFNNDGGGASNPTVATAAVFR